MKPVMLDSDILSEFLRGNKEVVERVDEYLKKHAQINFSVVTYYEILNGLLYRDAKKQLSRFIDFVELSNVLPLSMHTAKISAEIQADLRKKGKQIGHTDTLIAGIAIANDLQLVTNNIRHFKHVKGLSIINWKE